MKKVCYLSLLLLGGCVHSSFIDDLPTLKGYTMEQIRADFGQPSVVRDEERASLWTYHQDGCICLIFFDSDKIVQYAELRGQCADNRI